MILKKISFFFFPSPVPFNSIYRFKREEVKIQAWENHEKRKAELEMRRMEVLHFINIFFPF